MCIKLGKAHAKKISATFPHKQFTWNFRHRYLWTTALYWKRWPAYNPYSWPVFQLIWEQSSGNTVLNHVLNVHFDLWDVSDYTPVYVMSDFSGQPRSKLWAPLWPKLGTKHLMTARHHPQTIEQGGQDSLIIVTQLRQYGSRSHKS